MTPSAASPADLTREERAGDMIGAHGAGASGVARDNAQAAVQAGRAVEARDWLQLVDTIQRRIVRPVRDGAVARRSDWLAGGKHGRRTPKLSWSASMIVVPALLVAAIIAFALFRTHA
jgi:hypothetical protein